MSLLGKGFRQSLPMGEWLSRIPRVQYTTILLTPIRILGNSCPQCLGAAARCINLLLTQAGYDIIQHHVMTSYSIIMHNSGSGFWSSLAC